MKASARRNISANNLFKFNKNSDFLSLTAKNHYFCIEKSHSIKIMTFGIILNHNNMARTYKHIFNDTQLKKAEEIMNNPLSKLSSLNSAELRNMAVVWCYY